MNQTRNLIYNVIFNTVFTLGGFYLLARIPVDNCNSPLIGLVAFDVFALCVVGIVLYILDKVITHPDNISIIPPYGFFFLLYFFFKMLIGDVKKVRSVNASYYVRLSADKLFIYNFSVLKYVRAYEMSFSGQEYELPNLKKQIEMIANINGEFNFRTWDGSLDEESKRINTISKIVK